jgi:RNA polymerase sigma factor (sigma-70 family)
MMESVNVMKTASLNTVLGFVRRIAVRDAYAHTDRELLQLFIDRRDELAFTELVRRHGPMVLAACRRVLRHEQDAEDVFQAAFLVLARRADTIRQGETVGGWLHQVAYRLALRARDITARRREQGLASCINPDAPAADHVALDEELATLPEPYRSVVVLCYLEGRTQLEAARILATTTDAVNSRLKRARDLLRDRYARHALGLAALTVPAIAGELVAAAVRNALQFAVHPTGACGASAFALTLAKGAFPMTGSILKALGACACMLLLFAAGLLFATPPSIEDPLVAAAQNNVPSRVSSEPKPDEKGKPKRACIILWMSGGPSQIDTFDPKEGAISLFPAIDTNVNGLRFANTLPKLAKQAHHLAVIRGMSTRVADHGQGTHLMRTGYRPDMQTAHPEVGSVLARELEVPANTPRYVRIWQNYYKGREANFLEPEYGPLRVGGIDGFPNQPQIVLPDLKEFEGVAKNNAEAMRKNIAKAFNFDEEKQATRDAYGTSNFGQGCLLARRLVQAGVPVVEITMGGWDTHGDAGTAMPKLCGQLDAGLSQLLKDLEASKRLDSTLIVWMGEFGRTPRINANTGRDHWPTGFSVVLAGRGIKGGQAIGKTSDDGLKVDERPVSAAELHATIYQALGINSAKEHRLPDGSKLPYVEKGAKAVKEALR